MGGMWCSVVWGVEKMERLFGRLEFGEEREGGLDWSWVKGGLWKDINLCDKTETLVKSLSLRKIQVRENQIVALVSPCASTNYVAILIDLHFHSTNICIK